MVLRAFPVAFPISPSKAGRRGRRMNTRKVSRLLVSII